MYSESIAIILRDMATSEARAKIKAREEKYMRQHAMHAANAKQKSIKNKTIQIQRTRHK